MGLCGAIRLSGVLVALAPLRLFGHTIGGGGRSRISIAISVAVVIVAAAVLYHLLRDIEVGKIIAALEAQSRWRIFIAGALVVAGYSNLVCYDLFALHAIGKRNIPLRVVAFASFTSYTIGHSLGAATLTCGRQASVAINAFIMPLSAASPLPPQFRIACDNNCHFISHSCDGRGTSGIAGTSPS